MAALTVDFRKHSGPTPADDMAAQIITDCGNFTLDFKQHGFCASPLFLQTLGPWFTNEIQHLLSSEKRTLEHWATVRFFFSLAQVRCFWWCFWFRSGLVALFLKMSERGDSWCTDSSFSSLLVKLSQVFESALLDCILKLVVIPVACAHFLPSSQLCISYALIQHSVNSPPPLSVMTLCDLLSLWRGQWSSSGPLPSQQCSPLLCFQRTRDIQNLYCMDGHLLKLKSKYSYILKYWFITFMSCKL